MKRTLKINSLVLLKIRHSLLMTDHHLANIMSPSTLTANSWNHNSTITS